MINELLSKTKSIRRISEYRKWIVFSTILAPLWVTQRVFSYCRHGINLCYDTQSLLKGRRIFHVQRQVPRGGQQTKKGSLAKFHLNMVCLVSSLLYFLAL